MAVLKTGDPCPCCGQPIKTKDADVLRLLGWIAGTGRLPTMPEIRGLLGNPAAPEPEQAAPAKDVPAKDVPAKKKSEVREPCMFNEAILCQGRETCEQCGWNPDVTEQRCDARSIKLKYARRKRDG